MRDMSISFEERTEIEAFLYLEARLADESRYEEWEALFDDQIEYIVYGEGDDVSESVALLNDHRPRLATRIRQYKTERHFAQVPPSPMRRMLSNIEITRLESDKFEISCNFVVFELQVQVSSEMVIWPGRVTYRIRRSDMGFRLYSKKIDLVNRNEPLPNLAFLI